MLCLRFAQQAIELSLSRLNQHACTGKCARECKTHLSARVDAKQVVPQPVSCQAQLKGPTLDQLLQVCVHLIWYQQLVTCNTMSCQTGAVTHTVEEHLDTTVLAQQQLITCNVASRQTDVSSDSR